MKTVFKLIMVAAVLLIAVVIFSVLTIKVHGQQLISELTVQKDIVFQSYSPSPTTNKLYVIGTTLYFNGGAISPAGSPVTSVALTMPTGFTVTGSPVTGAGTLAVTTSLSGILKGTGSAFAVATADVDYAAHHTTLTGYGITDGVPTGRTINTHSLGSNLVLTNADIGSEPALGNPAADGYILSSSMVGARTWIPTPATGVTNVATGTGLTGGPITATGTISVNGILLTMANLASSAGVLSNSGSGVLSYNAAVGSTGITMSTGYLLGRNTASTGAIEQIALGTNLSFSGTTLNAAGATLANPTASLASNTAVNGTATSAIRSDGAFAISTTGVFQLGRLGLGAAADANRVLLTSTALAANAPEFLNTGAQSRIDIVSTFNNANTAVQFYANDSSGGQHIAGIYWVPNTTAASNALWLSGDATNAHLRVFQNGQVIVGSGGTPLASVPFEVFGNSADMTTAFWSGSATKYSAFNIGRTASDFQFGVAGAGGTGFTDILQGQIFLRSFAATPADILLGFGAGTASTVRFRATGVTETTGQISTLATTDATTTATGSIITAGGMGVAKTIWANALHLPSSGFAMRDTSAAYDLTVASTSSTAFTAGRTLTLDLVNASQTLKIQGNPTLDDWFNQSVKTTASPTFVALTTSAVAAVTTAAESWVGPSSTTGIYFKSGNVGIGTTAPLKLLHVQGSNPYITADALTGTNPGFMWWYQGAEKWRIDCITTTDLHLRFYNPSVGEVMKLFTTGALTIADALTTGAPAGGTAGAWKFGVYVTGAAVLDAAHYVQLDVGGTLYKLALAQ